MGSYTDSAYTFRKICVKTPSLQSCSKKPAVTLIQRCDTWNQCIVKINNFVSNG